MYLKRFPPELRTAAIVPRWSIVFTLNKDTVASHTYFVIFYARQIAKLINWQGSMEDLMTYAMCHDLDELITGDIVSPVKKEIIDFSAARNYIFDQMQSKMPLVNEDLNTLHNAEDIMRIVKAADCLDALLFLIMERRMGNGVVDARIEDARRIFEKAWMNLPGATSVLKGLFDSVMRPEISWHEHDGGFGV